MARCRLYVDDPVYEDICLTLCRGSGHLVTPFKEFETCRPDLTLILISLNNNTFEDLIDRHPYNTIFVVSLSRVIGRSNVVQCEDFQALEKKLALLPKTNPETVNPVETVKKRKRNWSRGVVKCRYCSREIINTVLAIRKHEKACEDASTREVAYGKMLILRQPNGRTRGSLLTVYIPKDIQVGGSRYQSGLHFVSGGKLIKALNAYLYDSFRYELAIESFQPEGDA